MYYKYFFDAQDNIQEVKKQFEYLETLTQFSLPNELKSFYEQHKIGKYAVLSNEFLCDLIEDIGCQVGFFTDNVGFYNIYQLFSINNFGWMKEREELLSIGSDAYHSSGLYICIKGANVGKVYSYEFGPSFEEENKQFDKFLKLADSFSELLNKLKLYTYDDQNNIREVYFNGKTVTIL